MNARDIITECELAIERQKNALLTSHIQSIEQVKEITGYIRGLKDCIEMVINKSNSGDNK